MRGDAHIVKSNGWGQKQPICEERRRTHTNVNINLSFYILCLLLINPTFTLPDDECFPMPSQRAFLKNLFLRILIIFDWIESICFMWIWEAREYWSCKSLRTFMSFPYIDLSQKGKQEEKECLKENSVGIEQWPYEDPQ